FNKDTEGEFYNPAPFEGGSASIRIDKGWNVQFQHYNGTIEFDEMEELLDLKEDPKYTHFAGTVKYKNTFQVNDINALHYLNLGQVHGISTVYINGKEAGVKWYGNRIYGIEDF